jgi:NADH:ubiquinone oxidoreductase subunit F (NADH-binding)
LSKQSVESEFAGVVASSSNNIAEKFAGKTRVTIQWSHCSASAGVERLAGDLDAALPDSAVLVVAGCDGACFETPVVTVGAERYVRVTSDDISDIVSSLHDSEIETDADSQPFFDPQTRIALEGCGTLDAENIDDYISDGGYAGLAASLSRTPEEVIEEVKTSGLRGRGGAYFPASLKWEAARNVHNSPRYLIVNCEEGEPGIFKDRHLMEGVPHRILEGAIIASYAAGVSEAIIYINAEANLSALRMEAAVLAAQEFGLLGENILSSGFDLQVEIRRGAGGYVCGEETTLMNTIEGQRREPRLRPPFPTESGLWAKPTVINNAETLASVPFIMTNGASALRKVGIESDPGTKIISLSGIVNRTGVAEVAMGTTLRAVIDEIGGGPREGCKIGMLGVGGPSSGVLPISMIDTQIKGGMLHDAGVMLGAGGLIVLDEKVGLLEVMRNLAAFNADESCGKCTPCREGTPRMVDLIDKIAAGDGKSKDIEELEYLARVVNSASLCGLGQAAGNPILSALHFFGDEMALLTSDS